MTIRTKFPPVHPKSKAAEDKSTPGKAIRAFCISCVGSTQATAECPGRLCLTKEICPLHPYRQGTGRPSVKTIREHCLICMNRSWKEVDACNEYRCPLYSYRLGTSPKRQKSIAKQEPIVKHKMRRTRWSSQNVSDKSPIRRRIIVN